MNKRVIITGVSGGIGRAMREIFEHNGYQVLGLDLVPPEASLLSKQANAAPNPMRFFEVDLSDAKSVKQVCRTLRDEGVKIDCLIHNAAFQREQTFIAEAARDDAEMIFERTLAVNVKAPYFLTQGLLPCFRAPASLIAVGSVHAHATSPGLAMYAASKAALTALTRSLALELGPIGIRVNTITPGAVKTPMLDRGLSRFENQDQALSQIKNSSPLQRIGEPKDIAQLAFFLSQPDLAANITGADFCCDSGVMARLPSE